MSDPTPREIDAATIREARAILAAGFECVPNLSHLTTWRLAQTLVALADTLVDDAIDQAIAARRGGVS